MSGYEISYHEYEFEDPDERIFALDDVQSFLKVQYRCEKQLVEYMFSYDAVNCCTAVLDGIITNPRIDIGYDPNGDGWTPLHKAASKGSYKITALLLQRGFSADVTCDWKTQALKNQLPLNVVLRALRISNLLHDWVHYKSAVKLVYKLCRSLRGLETVRKLMPNTKDMKQEFFNYVKEGKMVEVASMLMVDGKNLTPLHVSEGNNQLVFNSLKEIRLYMLAHMNIYPASIIGNDTLTEMKGTVLLLDIFDKIGDQLVAYVSLYRSQDLRLMIREVAHLIEGAGFRITAEDTYLGDMCFRFKSSLFEWKVLQICPPKGPYDIDLEKKLSKEREARKASPSRQLYTSMIKAACRAYTTHPL